jgi:hypothetical protein
MKDWMKPYLVEKSLETLRELGIEYKEDEATAKKSKDLQIDQRGYERTWVEVPVIYRIGRTTITGSSVNACNEGFMVESYLSSKTASKVFRILRKEPKYRLKLKYTYKGATYLRKAEVKHFHFDFSGDEPYRFTVGFWIPKTSPD